ncbi:hypothetical protein C2869_21380 [Saccharobesus litoralis]|uniref:DUF403 domain-containing protein n=1 Tax=Saccharobesus litoralis TaxID=2172099 RepID=A0A2S0VX68_9ALTE|nr:alpha-E domain-containing protein [Saccharobesus litoralis]AWB68793.1 hypothetical protein C2869_21380 [Saccharobesus litoralis]
MLSRVVETLYWMARYIERAENAARLVNITNLMLMDLPKGVSTGWEPIIDIMGVREPYLKQYKSFHQNHALEFVLVSEHNPSSIVNSLWNARENARTVRDVMPRGAWEGINALYNYANEHRDLGLSKRGRFEYLKNIISGAHLIFGELDATISHDEGYLFIRIGSLLERADMTTRILDVRSANLIIDDQYRPFENIQWTSLLRSLSAYQMYRKDMGMRIKGEQVLAFLLQNPHFPRSVDYCLATLSQLVTLLPNSEQIDAAINKASHAVNQADTSQLKNGVLHQFIDEIQIELTYIHDELAKAYYLK